MPTFFALIAQSVEHAAVNRSVTGSSPVWGAKQKATTNVVAFCFTHNINPEPAPLLNRAYYKRFLLSTKAARVIVFICCTIHRVVV